MYQYYPDYIDEDVAYLLGSIVARGEINYDAGQVTIMYPYKYQKINGTNAWNSIVISLDNVVQRFKDLGFDVDKQAPGPGKDILLILKSKPSSIEMRVLRYHLGNRTVYKEFEVPEVLWKSPSNIVREFVRGYSDVAAHIRASNRDEAGFHRVYIDVLFQNWKLPVQLCNLIQIKLKVPVHTITWAHPNIRDPNAKHVHDSSWWKKEHQIKIYAHDFTQIGFYIMHKQQLLEKYASENIKKMNNGEKPRHKPCKAVIRKHRKHKSRKRHPDENDQDIPEVIRGKHIDHYVEICLALGCNLHRGLK